MFSVTQAVSSVLPYVWQNQSVKHRLSVITSLVAVFLTIGLNLSAPILFKSIVNHFADDRLLSDVYDTNRTLLLTTFLLLLAYATCWTSGRLFEKFAEMIFFKPMGTAITSYCLALFKHIHSLGIQFHLERETGKVAGSIERSQRSIAMLIPDLLF